MRQPSSLLSSKRCVKRMRPLANNTKPTYGDYESRQEKIKEGKEKAEEFNRRFAEWYYVVPGESFEKLDLTRDDLVKPKEAEGEDGAEGDTTATPDTTPPFVPPAGAETAFDNDPTELEANDVSTDAEDEIAEPRCRGCNELCR